MSVTQPIERIEFAEKEVVRFRDDVEDWKRRHEELRRDCWVWEELIAKANFLFGRILELDSDFREAAFQGRMKYDPKFDDRIGELLGDWLRLALEVTPHADRLEGHYGEVEGADDLRKNIEEAKGIVTPDSEFFQGDDLVRLRDDAINAHRSGGTEIFFPDERIPAVTAWLNLPPERP